MLQSKNNLPSRQLSCTTSKCFKTDFHYLELLRFGRKVKGYIATITSTLVNQRISNKAWTREDSWREATQKWLPRETRSQLKVVESLHYRCVRLVIKDYRQRISGEIIDARTKRLLLSVMDGILNVQSSHELLDG